MTKTKALVLQLIHHQDINTLEMWYEGLVTSHKVKSHMGYSVDDLRAALRSIPDLSHTLVIKGPEPPSKWMRDIIEKADEMDEYTDTPEACPREQRLVRMVSATLRYIHSVLTNHSSRLFAIEGRHHGEDLQKAQKSAGLGLKR